MIEIPANKVFAYKDELLTVMVKPFRSCRGCYFEGNCKDEFACKQQDRTDNQNVLIVPIEQNKYRFFPYNTFIHNNVELIYTQGNCSSCYFTPKSKECFEFYCNTPNLCFKEVKK